MNNTTKSYYNRILDAIEAERKHEQQYYQSLSTTTSIAEKKERGLVIQNAVIKKIYYTLGDVPEILLSIDEAQSQNQFKVGSGCTLEHKHGDAKYKGTVSLKRKHEIAVRFSSDEMLDNVRSSDIFNLEVLYDERPYIIMKNAILSVLSTSDDHLTYLRDGLANGYSFEEKRSSPIVFNASDYTHLNASQIQAITDALDSSRIAIIHGPPGTGKTTTLAALIKILSENNKKVLACASSNNATNLITKKLNQLDVPVVRIGNLSRIDEDIHDLTLEGKVRNHKEWKNVKKIKIQAEEAIKKAKTFKRTFGADERQERREYYKDAKQLRNWARELESRIEDEVIDGATAITSTLIGISTNLTKDILFDTVIIDEASQALEAECWNAMLLAKHVILIGDHKQLPPVVKSPQAKKLDMETTLLDRFTPSLHHSSLLDVQYRMHEDLLAWSNNTMYDGRLKSHPSVAQQSITDEISPAVYLDTAGCGFDEAEHERTRSKRNEGEYFILREHILRHEAMWHGKSIGIISPYAAQVSYIHERIQQEEQWQEMDIDVNTIDGFQGQERDIIYLSLVRSNDTGEIGFLKDYRRLNVALTRSRYHTIVIGDSATICSDSVYAGLLDHLEKQGDYHSAWEYMQ